MNYLQRIEVKVLTMTEVMPKSKPRLVFYDLEWSQWFGSRENEIIQIGAVCAASGAVFSQAILPESGKMNPFVRKRIKLDIRKEDMSGTLLVFDMLQKQFLPTVNPKEGFERFLAWLEEVSEGHPVYMVSYGKEDIPILHSNLSKFGLDARLHKIVSKYVDFQMYLTHYMKDIPCVALKDLVKMFCENLVFRAHCADEDSKALMKVFNSIHQSKAISYEDYITNIENLKMVKIKTIQILKNSKEMKIIGNHLNASSEKVLLSGISGVHNILVSSSPLFGGFVKYPEIFQLEAAGYCISHRIEETITVKGTKRKKSERTELKLACCINKAYFLITRIFGEKEKSPFNILQYRSSKASNKGEGIVLGSGTPVSLLLAITANDNVKVDSIAVNKSENHVDIKNVLLAAVNRSGMDIQKVFSPRRPDEPSTSGVENNSDSRRISKMPDDPSSKHPVSLINEMYPGAEYECGPRDGGGNFHVTVTVEGRRFSGVGPNKKDAKKNCAVIAVKALLNIEY